MMSISLFSFLACGSAHHMHIQTLQFRIDSTHTNTTWRKSTDGKLFAPPNAIALSPLIISIRLSRVRSIQANLKAITFTVFRC